VEDADWRTILAMQQFRKEQGGRPDYGVWLKQGRPLSQLPSRGQDTLCAAKLRKNQGEA